MKGFTKGDPRAAAAGRKGGRMCRRLVQRSDDYLRGYKSGWKTGRREALEWIENQRVRDASRGDAS